MKTAQCIYLLRKLRASMESEERADTVDALTAAIDLAEEAMTAGKLSLALTRKLIPVKREKIKSTFGKRRSVVL